MTVALQRPAHRDEWTVRLDLPALTKRYASLLDAGAADGEDAGGG